MRRSSSKGAARLHARVHAGFEEAIGAAAVGLGAIKRQIGVFQQIDPGLSPSSGAMAIPTLAPIDDLMAVES